MHEDRLPGKWVGIGVWSTVNPHYYETVESGSKFGGTELIGIVYVELGLAPRPRSAKKS